MSQSNFHEIIPNLYIGNMYSAKDINFFKTHGIGAVVNATPDVPHYFANDHIEYMRINVNDSLKDQDFTIMSKYLPHAVSFVHKNLHLDNKPVLVHCHAGVQRSASIVAAYLMLMKNVNLETSIKYIIHKRPVAFFNGRSVNFLPSLTRFAKANGIELSNKERSRSTPHIVPANNVEQFNSFRKLKRI